MSWKDIAPKKKETIKGLKYIANSPSQEHGGFHPNTVSTAKSALAYIKKLEADLKLTQETLGNKLNEYIEKNKELEAKVKKLEGAIREIIEDYEDYHNPMVKDIVIIARKSLEGE